MSESLAALIPWGVIASVGLSFCGFVIGIRAGKNNVDRTVMRELYKTLFVHISDLEQNIQNGRPRHWGEFPIHGDRRMPPIHQMSSNGEIHLLPTGLRSRVLTAEKNALFTGWKWNEFTHKTLCPKAEELFRVHVEGADKALEKRSYIPIFVGALAMRTESEIADLVDRLDRESCGLGLETAAERSRTRQLYAYSEKMKQGSVGEFLSLMHGELTALPETKPLLEELNSAKAELSALEGVLTRRINDPHPFWEAVAQGIRDPLGR